MKNQTKDGVIVEESKTTHLLETAVDQDILKHGIGKLLKNNQIQSQDLKSATKALANAVAIEKKSRKRQKRDIFD